MGNYIQNASRFKYQYSREVFLGPLDSLHSLRAASWLFSLLFTVKRSSWPMLCIDFVFPFISRYQEFIRDRNHTHMNSTAWTTLTGFCNYLASTGKCKIDHDKEGVFFRSRSWCNRDWQFNSFVAIERLFSEKRKKPSDTRMTIWRSNWPWREFKRRLKRPNWWAWICIHPSLPPTALVIPLKVRNWIKRTSRI